MCMAREMSLLFMFPMGSQKKMCGYEYLFFVWEG